MFVFAVSDAHAVFIPGCSTPSWSQVSRRQNVHQSILLEDTW